MKPNPRDPCPCGSGRKYKRCCQQHDASQAGRYRIAIIAGVVLVAAGFLFLINQRSRSNAPTGAVAPGTASQAPLAGGAAPTPWQFDSLGNRYWDPNHNHWHNGPPPAPGQRTAATSAQVATDAGNANPNVPNPEPWQYDPTTNQHYDPGHGHWHSGPAPPPEQRTNRSTTTSSPIQVGGSSNTNPNVPNPTPWQYDPATNQYYDPGHGHWHTGQPPADRP